MEEKNLDTDNESINEETLDLDVFSELETPVIEEKKEKKSFFSFLSKSKKEDIEIPEDSINDSNNNSNLEDTLNNYSSNLNLDVFSELETPVIEEKKEKKSFFSFLSKSKKEDSLINDNTLSEDFIELENSSNSDDLLISKNSEIDLLNINPQEIKSVSIDTQTKENNIFNELDFSDLDFGNINEELQKVKKPFNALIFSSTLSTYLLSFTIFIIIGLFFNYLIKSTNSEFITSIPFMCDYIGSYIDGYSNENCYNMPKIISSIKEEKTIIEENIYYGITKLIPLKIESDFFLSKPEIKLIQEINAKKINYTKVFEDFEDLRKSVGGYEGKNIECSNFSFDKNGEISLSCVFYGSSIGELGNSSRKIAIQFLDKLSSSTSNFSLMDYPTMIEISKYNSTDGIKSIFSTTSKLNLKLKYNLSLNK